MELSLSNQDLKEQRRKQRKIYQTTQLKIIAIVKFWNRKSRYLVSKFICKK
ncbi:13846_t:CDS:1, partial [Racocetra persica]